MTNVSKRPVSEHVRASMYKQLVDLFVAQDTYKEHEQLLFELLTESERTMLAKRVTALALLGAGYAPRQIETMLSVSHVTVGKLQHEIEKGTYAHTAQTLGRRRGRHLFVKTLTALLTYGGAQKQLRANLSEDIKRWKAGM